MWNHHWLAFAAEFKVVTSSSVDQHLKQNESMDFAELTQHFYLIMIKDCREKFLSKL